MNKYTRSFAIFCVLFALTGLVWGQSTSVQIRQQTLTTFYPQVKVDGPQHHSFAFLPDGGMVLLYRAEKQTMLEWYGPDFKSRFIHKFPENTFPEQVEAFANGTVAAAVSLPHASGSRRSDTVDSELLLYYYAARTGKELFKTSLAGGQGIGPGQYWYRYAEYLDSCRIASNGESIAVFFKVMHNFSSTEVPNTHQGDMFLVLDFDGKIREGSTFIWTSSHSFWPDLLSFSNKDYLTVTTGDLYPYGIQFYNRTKKTDVVFWPPFDKATRDSLLASTVPATRTTVDPGRITEFISDGVFVFAAGQSDRDYVMSGTDGDPIIFKLRPDGTIVNSVYVDATPKIDYITMMRFVGDRLLVLWATDETQDMRYAWYSKDLVPLSTPRVLTGARAPYQATLANRDTKTSAWVTYDPKRPNEVTLMVLSID